MKLNGIKNLYARAKKWLFMKKDDIRDEKDLFSWQMKRIFIIGAVFLIFSLLLALALIELWREGEATVAVPNLKDKNVVEALITLQEKNLRGQVKPVSAFDKPENIVVDQEPKGGFFTKEKRSILLLVNKPVQEGELPNFVGTSLEEAKNRLASISNTNFAPYIESTAYTYSDTIEPGRIVAQKPKPGAVVSTSPGVKLLLSKGSGGISTTLPDFAGQDIEEALRWLAANDITVSLETDASTDRGKISSQKPSGGSIVRRGSQVSLVCGSSGDSKYGVFDFIFPYSIKLSQENLDNEVALTGQEEAGSVSTNTNLSKEDLEREERVTADEAQSALVRLGDSRAYQVRLYKLEGGTRSLLFEGSRKPGDQLIITFPYSGQAALEMLVGGQKFISRKYK